MPVSAFLKSIIAAGALFVAVPLASKVALAQTQTPRAEILHDVNPKITKSKLTKSEARKIKRLNEIHQKITQDYPKLRHVSRAGLQVWLNQDKPNLVLLDTRPVPEYRIAHIQGAIQINPDSGIDKLNALNLKDKIVIVYCSVGRRSSDYATRLETQLKQAGAQTVLNLEGGLFGWHNDGRKLVNADGETDLIHPYNGFWGGRYLTQKNKAAYSLK